MIHQQLSMIYHGYENFTTGIISNNIIVDASTRLKQYSNKPIDFIVEIAQPNEMCITNVKPHEIVKKCECEYTCDYGIDTDDDDEINEVKIKNNTTLQMYYDN
jgi:hypothetical protein